MPPPAADDGDQKLAETKAAARQVDEWWGSLTWEKFVADAKTTVVNGGSALSALGSLVAELPGKGVRGLAGSVRHSRPFDAETYETVDRSDTGSGALVDAVASAPKWAGEGMRRALRHKPADPSTAKPAPTAAEKDVMDFQRTLLSHKIPLDPLVEGRELGLLVLSREPDNKLSDLTAAFRHSENGDGVALTSLHNGPKWAEEGMNSALRQPGDPQVMLCAGTPGTREMHLFKRQECAAIGTHSDASD